MSDRLLKESDVLRIAFQLPLVVNSAFADAVKALPSADRPQGEWIPCSERLPRPYTEVLVCDECGWISLESYRPCDVTEKDSGWSTLTRIKIPTDGIIAWMPIPEPWKGADDE